MVGRAAALLGLAAGLGAYYALHDRLWDASTWWDVAFLSVVVIPACLGLVWFALPLREDRRLLVFAAVFAALTFAFHVAGWGTPENFAKLAAVTAVAFWFLSYFETVSWVVFVALIIPWVDAFSVFNQRGPTHNITEHHPGVFTALSVAFPIPGEDSSANLGLPDVLFFGLFLAAAVRFALRPSLAWTLMTASFGATIALAVWLNLRGLPALPLLSTAFLLANADLLWRRLRPRPKPPGGSRVGTELEHTRAHTHDRVDGEWGEGEWTAADLRRGAGE
jgi:hypothetical protein